MNNIVLLHNWLFFFGVTFCGVLPRWVSNELQSLIGLFLFIRYYYFKKKRKKKKIHQHILMFVFFLIKCFFPPQIKEQHRGDQMTPGPKSQLLSGIVVDTIPGPVSVLTVLLSVLPRETRIPGSWWIISPDGCWAEPELIGGPFLFSSNWSCGRWSGPALHPPLQTEWERW